jgi:hypothetical protein
MMFDDDGTIPAELASELSIEGRRVIEKIPKPRRVPVVKKLIKFVTNFRGAVDGDRVGRQNPSAPPMSENGSIVGVEQQKVFNSALSQGVEQIIQFEKKVGFLGTYSVILFCFVFSYLTKLKTKS